MLTEFYEGLVDVIVLPLSGQRHLLLLFSSIFSNYYPCVIRCSEQTHFFIFFLLINY